MFRMIRKTARLAALIAAVSLPAPARALDGIAAELGYGDELGMWRVALQWEWKTKWPAGSRWQVGGYWDLAAGAWYTEGARTLYDVGLTPVFRFERAARPSPYFEAAIGFHQISELRISADKLVGTNFQFGDHVGAGIRFGDRGSYDLGVRLQHLSNGGIRKPNPGVDFLQLRLQYHLD
jgi:lipid A 3-O-deacylase